MATDARGNSHNPGMSGRGCLKRLVIVLVCVIGVPVAGHSGWGCYGQWQLDAAIAEIRQAGEPILPEDFNVTDVREEDNAARPLTEAADSMGLTEECQEHLEGLLTPEVLDDRFEEVRALAEGNSEALELVRRARDLSGVDWGVPIRSPIYSTPLPHLRPQGKLIGFVCQAAVCDHRAGRDRESIEKLRDAVATSEAIGRNPGFLVCHLVSLGAMSRVVRAAEAVLPTLEVGAARGQAEGLLCQLLDENRVGAGLLAARYAERAESVDFAKLIFAELVRASPRVVAYLHKPRHLQDCRLALRFHRPTIEAALEANWPAAHAKLPADPTGPAGVEGESFATAQLLSLLSSLPQDFTQHFVVLAERRMAAIALATRLYRFDRGRPPEKLESLVPEYLAELPKDPLASDGRPIAYLPDSERPVLYSVGVNGADENGLFAVKPDGTQDYEAGDIVFFLNGDRPRPTTQPKGE